ncbi:hypothetical protein [Ideonella sp. YS5]|uniref:hypothetical protein n=1 Tax=Ideonella sp. YS5 TaxID=3453714 RepID=UPI003EEB2AD3
MPSQTHEDLRDHDVRIPAGESMEGQEPYAPTRRHWPGILAALVIALAVILLAIGSRDEADDLSQATATDATQRIGPAVDPDSAAQKAREPAVIGSAPSP